MQDKIMGRNKNHDWQDDVGMHKQINEIAVFPAEKPDAPLVLFHTVQGEAEAIAAAVRAMTETDCSLAGIAVSDWNSQLTPWEAPALRKKDVPFSGGADAYLHALTGEILPGLMSDYALSPRYTALAGYSLAGLFALYAMYCTDVFSRFASVSGSLWYPSFAEFAAEHVPLRQPDCVYLSVGDREASARHPLLRTVEDHTRAMYALCRKMEIPSAFVLNSGTHFDDPEKRTAKGIVWMLEQ